MGTDKSHASLILERSQTKTGFWLLSEHHEYVWLLSHLEAWIGGVPNPCLCVPSKT